MSVERRKKKEFGDFQTPIELAQLLCAELTASGINPRNIVEPTCGVGNFAGAALATWSKAQKLIGFDINPDYVAQARALNPDPKASFHEANFFVHDWDQTLGTLTGTTLVVGNLPWVTNAEMGSLGGSNLPAKNNFQSRAGFDAITGKANFDISEWMLLKILDWCEKHDVVVALLVKTGVARKLLNQAWEQKRHICRASIRRIDTMRWFEAAVDACILVFRSGTPEPEPECPVFPEVGSEPESILGYRNGSLVGDVRSYHDAIALLGGSPLRWRSGVKHDCAKVMEFHLTKDGLVNGLEERVEIEDTYLFPLFKSSQLAKGATATTRRVMVTQRRVGEDTSVIEAKAPKTWKYLLKHGAALDARGSSIYKKNARFSMFGIGDYSFSPFKVAISGLYKAPRFVLLHEIDGKPSMVDDTACFLSFEDRQDATVVLDALNSPKSLAFLAVFAFPDAKRPYTVELLSKLSLEKLVEVTHGTNKVPAILKPPRRHASGKP